MKICRDCRFYRRTLLFAPTCARIPKDYQWYFTNPVTGERTLMGNRSCAAQRFLNVNRAGYESCGPDGQYWEKR